jgi:GGDEF domain-containing protein
LANFTAFGRRKGEVAPGLTRTVREALPTGFDAVAEALVAGSDATDACAVVGRVAARDGASLGEALTGLRTTYRLLKRGEPSFDATESLSLSWSDATLEYLHQLSCEDPMTGLASLPHVRTRLADIYREAEKSGTDVRVTKALVIVEMKSTDGISTKDHFSRVLCLARVAETMRQVFSGDETIGKLGSDRVVALVSRETELGVSVALMRDLLLGLNLTCGEPRVWIEGLPANADSAIRLLDELAR